MSIWVRTFYREYSPICFSPSPIYSPVTSRPFLLYYIKISEARKWFWHYVALLTLHCKLIPILSGQSIVFLALFPLLHKFSILPILRYIDSHFILGLLSMIWICSFSIFRNNAQAPLLKTVIP
uniref:Uncharacterized protein n=1 Tax=Arundo donax TaxID=35708 RepID=A0A0A9CMJ2_ARUDO